MKFIRPRTLARLGLSWRFGPAYVSTPLLRVERGPVFRHLGCPVAHRRADTRDRCSAAMMRSWSAR